MQLQACPRIRVFSVHSLFQNMSKVRTRCNTEIQQPKHVQHSTHIPLPPYSRFTAEVFSILLLVFSLFALVAA
jgi:hypothetical protein